LLPVPFIPLPALVDVPGLAPGLFMSEAVPVASELVGLEVVVIPLVEPEAEFAGGVEPPQAKQAMPATRPTVTRLNRFMCSPCDDSAMHARIVEARLRAAAVPVEFAKARERGDLA
jgi:hypothetical protein